MLWTKRCGWLLLGLTVGCGGDGDSNSMGWEPSESGSSGGATSASSLGSVGDDSTSEDSALDTTGDTIDPSVGESSTSGEPPVDCTPVWSPAFVGSPCASDGDCGFEGGRCITEGEGFPCGTCSVACDGLCPDQDGAPATFCVDTADIELADSGGTCLSRCEPSIVGGNGCRDGYACAVYDRFGEPPSSAGVCVPSDQAGGGASTACQEMLLELGAVFTPTNHEPDSPEGHPSLLCDIEDPVLLYGPVNGVSLEGGTGSDAPVLVGCNTAVSIVGSAAVASMLGAETIIHYGTYNCRVISGTSTLSEHGHARAIDIAGFVLEDGTTASVLADWEDGVADPVTPLGQMLRGFTDQVWGMGLWNIILTPEFNEAHDDHFHIDLTPGGNTYD